jgi:hypothetical protein
MKYPIQWGISYKNKTYLKTYGKKKAHDLCLHLSGCLQNLSVVPILHSSERDVLLFSHAYRSGKSRKT